MVNPLAKKNEITVERTVGPDDRVITITYTKGKTAGDILINDLHVSKDKDYLFDIVQEKVLSPNDIIPPNARLVLIPSSSGGLFEKRNRMDLKRLDLVRDLGNLIRDTTKNRIYNIPTRSWGFLTKITEGTERSYNNFISNRYSNRETIDLMLNLMRDINKLSIEDFKKYQKDFNRDNLNNFKQKALDICAKYLKSEVYTDFTSELFDTLYQKAFSNSREITLFNDFEGIKLGFEILSCIEKFYGDSDAYRTPKVIQKLERKFNLIRESKDQIGLLNHLTKNIWGRTYRQLLVDSCRIKQSTDAKYIQELKNSNTKFTEEDIIWITKNKDGKIIWLELGKHDYEAPYGVGVGLVHIYARHLENQFDRWGLMTPKEQAQFFLDVLSDPKADTRLGKKDYIYYKIKTIIGSGYIAFQISNNGFVITSHPYSNKDGDKLFK